MQDTDLLIELLERLGLLLRTERRRRSSSHGLSEVHLALLDYLARCNRFSNTPGAASEYLGITKGTISQSIKLLESRGLVRKQTDKEDKRITRLTLTRKGMALAQRRASDSWYTFLQCGSCRHLQSSASGHFCGLTRQPLEASDLDKICMEHESVFTVDASGQ